MRQRLLAKAATLRAAASTPTSPRSDQIFGVNSSLKQLSQLSSSDDSRLDDLSKRSRPRRNSLFEWGRNSFRIEIIGVEKRLKALQEYVKKK